MSRLKRYIKDIVRSIRGDIQGLNDILKRHDCMSQLKRKLQKSRENINSAVKGIMFVGKIYYIE